MKLAYLNVQIKNQRICKLDTGDLVKIKADIPFIYHYGIIFKEGETLWFYHFHPDFRNRFGGNVLREDFINYIKNKDIVSIEKSNIKKEDIYDVLEQYKSKKYDVFNNNCEHFVNFVKDQKPISKQIKYGGLGLALGIATYLLTRKK